jgi:hypothetical protein
MIQETDFTRIANDVNGNPRYVCHFAHLVKDGDGEPGEVSKKYIAALNRALELGGKKFHNKQFGGGIVFQSYSVAELCNDINNLLRGPVEWAQLWAAMDAAPHEWIETTEAMYWDMLECVPPRKMDQCKFLVGEPQRHNEQGEAVYACFKKYGTRIYARYRTVSQYAYV